MEPSQILKIKYLICATIEFVRKITNFHYITHKIRLCIAALYKQDTSIAVLTGGNRGLGLPILKKLLECEITVILGRMR